MKNVNLNVPDDNLRLKFEADISLLEWLSKQIEMSGSLHVAKKMNEYIKTHNNSQHFYIIAGNEETSETNIFKEFIEDEEMEL